MTPAPCLPGTGSWMLFILAAGLRLDSAGDGRLWVRTMNFVSVTRLRIRKWRFVPGFLYLTLLSLIQAKRAEGNLGTSLERDSHLTFWTITVWRDEHAMRAFRNHGAHQRAMPKLREWCDEATYAHWLQESGEPPDPATAFERLVREGIVSRVNHPSRDHASRNFPPPRKSISRGTGDVAREG